MRFADPPGQPVLPLDARRAASLSARNGIGIGSQDVRNFRGHRAVLRTAYEQGFLECAGSAVTPKRRGEPLFVGLPQGDGFGLNHLVREGPARAAWAALTRSAKTAIVKFVQAVWFVRQPCVTNAEEEVM